MVAKAATKPRHFVGQGDGRQDRSPVRLAVDGGEPRHGLGQGGEARTVGIRPVLAEAGDAGDDEVRVALVQDVGADAQALHGAGAEVLHHHVGVVAQLEQLGATLG